MALTPSGTGGAPFGRPTPLSANSGVPMHDAMSAVLARNWWAMALRGIVAILFGLVAFAVPAAVMLSLALLFSAYLLVDGVFAIIASVRAAQSHERWGLLLAEGVVDLIMAALVFLFPGGAVVGFVWATAIWALLSGGLMLGAAFRLHVSHGRLWMALGGIVSLIWGVMLLLAPLLGALVLTWWLGTYAIVFGVVLLVLGFRLRSQHGHAVGGTTPQAV